MSGGSRAAGDAACMLCRRTGPVTETAVRDGRGFGGGHAEEGRWQERREACHEEGAVSAGNGLRNVHERTSGGGRAASSRRRAASSPILRRRALGPIAWSA